MKLDPAKVQALTDALRGGTDLETACHFAGLSVGQVLRWLEIGKNEAEAVANGLPKSKGLESYVKLWEDLKKARADAIVRNVTHSQKAATDNWQAAAWWLERTVPEHYSKRTAKPAEAVESAPKKPLES
jgi:hypothetical protein